jgi:hypothetical protein
VGRKWSCKEDSKFGPVGRRNLAMKKALISGVTGQDGHGKGIYKK